MKVIMKCVYIKFWDLLGCFHYILNDPRIRVFKDWLGLGQLKANVIDNNNSYFIIS